MSKRFPVRYVVPVGRGWRYRRLVPPDLHDTLDRKNWTHQWPLGTLEEKVIREARQLARQHDTEIARARGDTETAEVAEAEADARSLMRDSSTEDLSAFLTLAHGNEQDRATNLLVEAILGGGTIKRKTVNLSQALKRDRELYSADRDPRPIHYAVESFIAAVGDVDVMQISRSDVSTWIAAQREAGYSPATVRRRYGSLKAMVDRTMRDLGSEKRSPFEHRTGGKSSPTDRLPLNKDMLDKLNTYLDRGRCGFETVAILKLMMFTGASLAEIAGLAMSDVSLDGKVPFIHVRENGVRPLKAPSRARRVPLIGPAAGLAAEAVKRVEGREQLFKAYSSTRGADSLSARLNLAVRASGIPKSRRLTTHSLRHSMSEALRLSGASYSMQRRLLGHSARDISDHYGSPAALLEEARKALKKAIRVLGQVDDSVYGPHERL